MRRHALDFDSFPFPIDSPVFEMRMDAAGADGPIVVVDKARFAAELRLRRDLSNAHPAYVHICPMSELDAAWEAADLLFSEASAHYPQYCSYDAIGETRIWRCSLSGDERSFRIGHIGSLCDEATSPLDLVGRSLQEDLVLLRSTKACDAPVVVAGHVCFASGWSLDGKMGQDIGAVHEPVPGYAAAIGHSTDLLVRRLKPQRTVMRWNWTIADSTDMDRSPRAWASRLPAGPVVTAQNAGEQCVFRVERQTLTRLPHCGALLFTIHTYIAAIAGIASKPERRALLLSNLETMPAETAAYKNAGRFLPALLQYLRSAP